MFKTWSILFFQFFCVNSLFHNFSYISPNCGCSTRGEMVGSSGKSILERWSEWIQNFAGDYNNTAHFGAAQISLDFSELFRFVRRNFDYSAQIREKWFRLKMPRKEREKSSKIKLGLKQTIEQSENYLYLFQPTSTMLPQYLPWHVSFGKVLSDPVRVRTWEIPDGSIPTRQEPLLGDLNPCRSTQLLPKPTLANSSSTTQDVQIPHTLRTPDAHAPYLHAKP